MIEVELPRMHCYRCGNEWTPRARVVRLCPRCKSRYWDEPRIRVPVGGDGLGIRDVLLPHIREINRISKKYGARDIRVFGSVARSAATERSDIDLLVHFDAKHRTPSGLKSIDFALELEELLHRHVDVVTEDSLPWLIQPQIVTEAVPL